MRASGVSLSFCVLLAACSGQDDTAAPPSQPPARPAQTQPETDVKTELLEYRAEGDGAALVGYFAWDAARSGQRPGVLVVHEWWGLNDYVRQRARQLAELGYSALALDMYGDGKLATHPDDAQGFMTEVLENMPVAVARFNAALDLLRSRPTTDPERIAAIGYCFGGGVVLHMARIGADLGAVVSFHGSLAPIVEAEPGKVKARVLVLHGGDDPFVPAEQAEAFKEEMDAAGVDYRFVRYEGAKHAFTNPGATAVGETFSLPLAYDEEADRDSWRQMREFLDEVFGKTR